MRTQRSDFPGERPNHADALGHGPWNEIVIPVVGQATFGCARSIHNVMLLLACPSGNRNLQACLLLTERPASGARVLRLLRRLVRRGFVGGHPIRQGAARRIRVQRFRRDILASLPREHAEFGVHFEPFEKIQVAQPFENPALAQIPGEVRLSSIPAYQGQTFTFQFAITPGSSKNANVGSRAKLKIESLTLHLKLKIESLTLHLLHLFDPSPFLHLSAITPGSSKNANVGSRAKLKIESLTLHLRGLIPQNSENNGPNDGPRPILRFEHLLVQIPGEVRLSSGYCLVYNRAVFGRRNNLALRSRRLKP